MTLPLQERLKEGQTARKGRKAVSGGLVPCLDDIEQGGDMTGIPPRSLSPSSTRSLLVDTYRMKEAIDSSTPPC